MAIVDVLVHVAQVLDWKTRQKLEEGLRRVGGVIAPRFAETAPHLLLVAYDSETTSAAVVLTHISAEGYQARLVGL
jgi:hypothetical protein